eukprot:TRINITY_DN10323_c0_g1_i1.p2 TRINITY_DN10323_c0_g1~~TRINITY_DN10323_c0_g1_i1.p2  ORF type:complete len:111 (+),score=11.74 TRINITY_DN10323_c0_g1_i1:196-528(+)
MTDQNFQAESSRKLNLYGQMFNKYCRAFLGSSHRPVPQLKTLAGASITPALTQGCNGSCARVGQLARPLLLGHHKLGWCTDARPANKAKCYLKWSDRKVTLAPGSWITSK